MSALSALRLPDRVLLVILDCADADLVSPDFGFVPMNEHLPQDHHHHYSKVTGEL